MPYTTGYHWVILHNHFERIQNAAKTITPSLKTQGRRAGCILLSEHAVDVLQGLTNQLLAAHMANIAGGHKGAVVAALLCLLGGQIALGTAAQLNQEGLFCQGTGLDLVTVIQEQLEGVGSEGHGTQR